MNYIISPLQAASDQAVVKPKEDVAHYLQQIGFQPLWYNRFIKFEGDGDWAGRIEGMLGPVQAGEVVIYQTPTYADITIEKYIIEAVHQRHAKIVAFVQDVEYLRYPELYPKVEWLDYLNSFDVVMVSTTPMAAAIKADGVKRPIIISGPWGYVEPMTYHQPSFSRTLHYAGNLMKWKSGFLRHVPASLDVQVYGSENGQTNLSYPLGPGVTYRGTMSQAELGLTLTNGFGLIWDEDDQGHYAAYARINQAHKFSLYLALGLPVIANRESAIGAYIEQNQVGLVIDHLTQLPDVMAAQTEATYGPLVDQVKALSALIRAGRHTQLAALKAVLAAHDITSE